MIVTALLVKYAGGLHWVEDSAGIDTYGRREGYLTLDVNSVEQVESICAALFVEKAHPQITTAAQIEPTGDGDTPFTDFTLSDWVNAPDEAGSPESVRVRGLGVEEDADGNLTYPIVLRSQILEFEDRVARWLKRMANGTLSGSVASAGPVSSVPEGDRTTAGGATVALRYSHPGALFVTPESDATGDQADEAFDSAEVEAHLVQPGDTDSVFTLYRGHVDDVIGSVTVPAGSEDGSATIANAGIGARDWVLIRTTTPGDNARTATVIVRPAAADIAAVDGGTPDATGPAIYDGDSPTTTYTEILDGGTP